MQESKLDNWPKSLFIRSVFNFDLRDVWVEIFKLNQARKVAQRGSCLIPDLFWVMVQF